MNIHVFMKVPHSHLIILSFWLLHFLAFHLQPTGVWSVRFNLWSPMLCLQSTFGEFKLFHSLVCDGPRSVECNWLQLSFVNYLIFPKSRESSPHCLFLESGFLRLDSRATLLGRISLVTSFTIILRKNLTLPKLCFMISVRIPCQLLMSHIETTSCLCALSYVQARPEMSSITQIISLSQVANLCNF